MTALEARYSKACESPEAGVTICTDGGEVSRSPLVEVGLHRGGEGVSIEIQ